MLEGSIRVKVLTHKLMEIHSPFIKSISKETGGVLSEKVSAGTTNRHMLVARQKIESHAICSKYHFAFEYVAHASLERLLDLRSAWRRNHMGKD